jgi:hypothetical protein
VRAGAHDRGQHQPRFSPPDIGPIGRVASSPENPKRPSSSRKADSRACGLSGVERTTAASRRRAGRPRHAARSSRCAANAPAALAGQRGQRAHQRAHQRALARAVASQQPDARAALDGQARLCAGSWRIRSRSPDRGPGSAGRANRPGSGRVKGRAAFHADRRDLGQLLEGLDAALDLARLGGLGAEAVDECAQCATRACWSACCAAAAPGAGHAADSQAE